MSVTKTGRRYERLKRKLTSISTAQIQAARLTSDCFEDPAATGLRILHQALSSEVRAFAAGPMAPTSFLPKSSHLNVTVTDFEDGSDTYTPPQYLGFPVDQFRFELGTPQHMPINWARVAYGPLLESNDPELVEAVRKRILIIKRLQGEQKQAETNFGLVWSAARSLKDLVSFMPELHEFLDDSLKYETQKAAVRGRTKPQVPPHEPLLPDAINSLRAYILRSKVIGANAGDRL